MIASTNSGSPAERRRRRSADAITALHYQLAHARREGGFDALVLVDGGGALVAGAGAWPICEELAAFAPLLADRTAKTAEVELAASALRGHVIFRKMDVDGAEVFLAARRGEDEPFGTGLLRAADGCLRILGVPPTPDHERVSVAPDPYPSNAPSNARSNAPQNHPRSSSATCPDTWGAFPI